MLTYECEGLWFDILEHLIGKEHKLMRLLWGSLDLKVSTPFSNIFFSKFPLGKVDLKIKKIYRELDRLPCNNRRNDMPLIVMNDKFLDTVGYIRFPHLILKNLFKKKDKRVKVGGGYLDNLYRTRNKEVMRDTDFIILRSGMPMLAVLHEFSHALLREDTSVHGKRFRSMELIVMRDFLRLHGFNDTYAYVLKCLFEGAGLKTNNIFYAIKRDNKEEIWNIVNDYVEGKI